MSTYPQAGGRSRRSGTRGLLPGFRMEQVTPVDVLTTRDGKRAYVALGRANHVAVVDVAARKVLDYILVGKRAWGLALTYDESRLYVANGLSDDISIIDAERLRVLTSIPVGQVPYGILIDDLCASRYRKIIRLTLVLSFQ